MPGNLSRVAFVILTIALVNEVSAKAESFANAYARGVKDYKSKSGPPNGTLRSSEELEKLQRESFKGARDIDDADRSAAAKKASKTQQKIGSTMKKLLSDKKKAKPAPANKSAVVAAPPKVKKAAPADVKPGGAEAVTFKGTGAPAKDESGASAGGADEVKFTK